MKRVRILLTMSALATSGCNLAPVYSRPTVATPMAYKEAGNWQPATPADSISRGHWWEMYGDGELNGLEREIDTANPTLAAAAAAYEQARSFAAEARAGLLPSVELDGGLSANKQSASRPLRSAGQPTYYGANTLDATASYELDLWGRVRAEVAAAKAQAQAVAADLESVRLMLHAELATNYLDLRGLDEQAKLLDDTVGAYRQAYELTNALYQGKIASPIDVARAATQLHAAEAQVSDIAGRRALLEHAIATLVGKPPADVTIAAAAVQVSVPDIPTGIPSTLLQRRPDVASAERKAAAANQGVGIAKAAFYPSLSIGGTAGFQNTSLNLLNLPQTFWSVGPGVALPLIDGGLRRAELRAARAAFEKSTNDYRATVLNAFREVEDNLALLKWLDKESQQEQEAAHAAEDAVDMSMTLYRNGADSYLDVVTAQTASLAAQRAVLALQTRRAQASVDLIRALGGGWSSEDTAQPKLASVRRRLPVARLLLHFAVAEPCIVDRSRVETARDHGGGDDDQDHG
jgi:NodT family efflux transporter outer membrane factor (OMF) lipoprotein